MNQTVTRVAEAVLPGHPDKLADAIADAIVDHARQREARALVGVEVAVHRNVVFIDGRVACRDAETIDFKQIASEVYRSAGYDKTFPPNPTRLRMVKDICLGPLLDRESEFRSVADDQAIVTGYACSTPGTDYLPVEQAIVLRLCHALFELRREEVDLQLGPDGKVIVFIDESADGRSFELREVCVSIQHTEDWNPIAAHRAIELSIQQEIERLADRVPGLVRPRGLRLNLNPVGDFVEGGPYGDNGLSGKKLVVDFYGPRVPIGGGAMSGKDFFKADRAGPIIARRLAVAAVQRYGQRTCQVTLGIRPGDSDFHLLQAECQGERRLDPVHLEGVVDLRLDSVADWPDLRGDLVEVARFGHFIPDRCGDSAHLSRSDGWR